MKCAALCGILLTTLAVKFSAPGVENSRQQSPSVFQTHHVFIERLVASERHLFFQDRGFQPLAQTLFQQALTTPAAFGLAQERVNSASPEITERPAEAPFAKEIEAFEASDKKNPPPSGAVLFLGSSSIRLWTTLEKDFAEIPVINRGFGGSQIADSVRYAERIVFPYKPKMIVFYAGTNDLNAGKSPAQVSKDFQEFAGKVHAALPATRIVYLSINPSVARWKQEANILEANQLIRRFTQTKTSKSWKLSFLDSHSRLLSAEGMPRPEILREDGLHLNAKGYTEWTAILKPQVLALWKAATK